MRWQLRIAIVLYGVQGLSALVDLVRHGAFGLDLALVPVCVFLWLRQDWARLLGRCWNWLAILACACVLAAMAVHALLGVDAIHVHLGGRTWLPAWLPIWVMIVLVLAVVLWLDWVLRHEAVIACMEQKDSGAATIA